MRNLIRTIVIATLGLAALGCNGCGANAPLGADDVADDTVDDGTPDESGDAVACEATTLPACPFQFVESTTFQGCAGADCGDKRCGGCNYDHTTKYVGAACALSTEAGTLFAVCAATCAECAALTP